LAKRGPKPTPAKLLKLHNSWRAKKRPSGDNLDQKCPACPKRLILKEKTAEGEAIRVIARTTWKRLAPLLHRAGLLVDQYREPFELLCDSYARYVYACRMCNTEGMVEMTPNGFYQQNAWLTIRNKMWDQVCKGSACFGMTPSDIAGVTAREKPNQDKGKERFFKGA
jgi:P27 family predicted phage terminase small subunit